MMLLGNVYGGERNGEFSFGGDLNYRLDLGII